MPYLLYFLSWYTMDDAYCIPIIPVSLRLQHGFYAYNPDLLFHLCLTLTRHLASVLPLAWGVSSDSPGFSCPGLGARR